MKQTTLFTTEIWNKPLFFQHRNLKETTLSTTETWKKPLSFQHWNMKQTTLFPTQRRKTNHSLSSTETIHPLSNTDMKQTTLSNTRTWNQPLSFQHWNMKQTTLFPTQTLQTSFPQNCALTGRELVLGRHQLARATTDLLHWFQPVQSRSVHSCIASHTISASHAAQQNEKSTAAATLRYIISNTSHGFCSHLLDSPLLCTSYRLCVAGAGVTLPLLPVNCTVSDSIHHQ